MKKFNFLTLILMTFVLACSGCAKVAHLQELLRLKGYSEEKDHQGLLVEQQNKRFERLLTAAKDGSLRNYSNQKSIWKIFGSPIFESKVTVAETSYDVWMYRYSTKLFGSDKVYLYFDPQGKLKIYDYSPGGSMTPVKSLSAQ